MKREFVLRPARGIVAMSVSLRGASWRIKRTGCRQRPKLPKSTPRI
jgi:hypothetical protein